MTGRINRCSHCGCDEPILGIDGKLYCDNCGMCLESTLPSHAQASKLESDKKMLECARELKKYCAGFDGDCMGCLFDTDNDECVLISFVPKDWDLCALSKTKAVEVLKEMRENISGLDGDKVKNKVTALTMAIKALEG